MWQAMEYVAEHPGCMKIDVARAVGPYGSKSYGYAIVDRTIRAGLIRAEFRVNHYALYPSHKP